MAKAPKLSALAFSALLALSACSSEEPETVASTETSSDTEAEIVSDIAEPVEASADNDEAPTEDPVVEEPDDNSGDETGENTPEEDTEADTPTCVAPELQPHFVDVALDDPDGGLNVRSAAGAQNDVLLTVARSKELITTGGCSVVGTVDWWEVTTSDGSLTGWASSRFLSDQLVFNPGLGKAITDTDNVGIGGETLDEMAANLAVAYGFDEDVVITMVGEVEVGDAQGGKVVYDLTGAKDDSISGYQVEIDFLFDKNEEENGEIEGYTALRIINYALCSRGVSEDGVCI